MRSRVRRVAGIVVCVALSAAGCAADKREATAGKVRLTAAREPFTFSSWDVARVEWSAPPGDAGAVPPNVAAVLADGTVVPLRTLTLARARSTAGMAVGQPARCDDGHGAVYDPATPVTAGGFHFDFAGDRLVHFVAAEVDQKDGSVTQPVFRALAVDRRDANGDSMPDTMPLGHDQCVDLFGTAEGLQTDLAVPGLPLP